MGDPLQAHHEDILHAFLLGRARRAPWKPQAAKTQLRVCRTGQSTAVMTPTLPVTRTPSLCPAVRPASPPRPALRFCVCLCPCAGGRLSPGHTPDTPRGQRGATAGAALGATAGGRPGPGPPARSSPGAEGPATPSRARRSLTVGAGAAGSAAGRGDGPRPASDRGAGREGGGLPFGVGRVNICRKPGRLFHLAEAQGGRGGGRGATSGTRCPGKGAKSGARCARSPLHCRIRYPAAAAVSHPRPRQRQPRRGVGSQTSRGAEPPLSSDEPGGAASASRVRARREPRLCRRGGVRHPCGGDGGDGAGGGSGGGEPLGGRAGKVSVGQGRCGGGTVTQRARCGGEALPPGPRVPEDAAVAAQGEGRRRRGAWGAKAPPLQARVRWLPTAGMLVGANGKPHPGPVLLKKEKDSILCPAAQRSGSSWAKGASLPNSLISLLLAAGSGRKSGQLPAAAGDVSKAASRVTAAAALPPPCPEVA